MSILKEHEDAYGRQMLDYYTTGQGIPIIERDDGYINASSPGILFMEYAEWPVIEQQAMDFVRGRVLDIGCGPGRHALYLQEKGHEVVGIDNSPLAIEVAKKRGLRDLAIMATLYDTGARVKELIDLKAVDVRLDIPATVMLTGKGGKQRCVPIMGKTRSL